MLELNIHQLDEVHGGVKKEVARFLAEYGATKLLDGLGSWFGSASRGGADSTTWTNIGNSQMGA